MNKIAAALTAIIGVGFLSGCSADIQQYVEPYSDECIIINTDTYNGGLFDLGLDSEKNEIYCKVETGE